MATTPPLHGPVPLEKDHEVSGFDCGAAPLNDFLRKHAWHNQQNRSARTYVVLRGQRVVGYYSLAAASVEREEAAPRVAKGLAKHPIPVVLLGQRDLDHPRSSRQIRTVESSLAVANIRPSNETLIENMRPRCPVNFCNSVPVATSQT